jgi:hypothetical protein
MPQDGRRRRLALGCYPLVAPTMTPRRQPRPAVALSTRRTPRQATGGDRRPAKEPDRRHLSAGPADNLDDRLGDGSWPHEDCRTCVRNVTVVTAGRCRGYPESPLGGRVGRRYKEGNNAHGC